eukprot:m.255562 g.255562  ORF g.255562 m.255562 type:complete len:172 (+) comp19162_c1_seq6:1269-1784(+)
MCVREKERGGGAARMCVNVIVRTIAVLIHPSCHLEQSTTELWNAITVGVDDAADVDDIELFILTHLDAALSYSYVAKFYGFYFLYGALLTWLFGATIGKGLLGLRVIMIGTQRKPTKLASIGRQAIKTLLLLVASLLCFLCILPGGATLHDRLCSTQVIVAPRFHPRQQTR